MPCFRMTLKILLAAALVAVFSLAVVSGPTVSLNPLGMYDDNADYELKAQLAPVHNLPGPTEEEIALKNAENESLRPKNVTRGVVAPAYVTNYSANRDDKSVFLAEDFESYAPSTTSDPYPVPGWTRINTVPDYTWFIETATSGGVPNGTQASLCPYGPVGSPLDEWMITPLLDVTGANSALRVDFAYLNDNATYPFTLDLLVSTTGTAPGDFTLRWEALNEAHTSMEWTTTSVDLSAYAGTSIYLAWRYMGEDANLGGIDDVYVLDEAEATGRCCYGDVTAPDCDDLTLAACQALSGSWDASKTCAGEDCPIANPPVNDEVENAITVVPPETVTGTTIDAQIDCPGDLDQEAVWYTFEAPFAENDVYVNYCGTATDIYSIGLALYAGPLPLDCAATLIADGYAFNDCGDATTNPDMNWDRLPGPATYYLPVYADDGAKGGLDFSFDITLTESPALPAGASCGDPYLASYSAGDGTITIAGMTTCGYGDIYGGQTTCLGYYDQGEDWICELTLNDAMDLKIELDPGVTTYGGFAVADACTDFTTCITTVSSSSAAPKSTVVTLAAGTYYIMVDTWAAPDCIPAFDLTFSEFVSTSGDNCGDPISVKLPDDMTSGAGSDEYQDNNFTCGRINDYTETALGGYDGGEDIIYMLDVGSDIDVDILLDPLGTTWTGIILSSVCPDDGTSLLFSTASGSGVHGLYNVSLTTGIYYLMMDTYPSPDCIPAFDLTIKPTAGALANDDYANCEAVYDGVEIAFSTATATFDGPGGCLTSPNIWYCYEATCDGLGTFSLCNSGYDTKIAVYDGTDPNTATQIACEDDGTACDGKSIQSEATVGVVAGNTYLIEVGGYSSNVGAGVLNVSCVECPAPENNNCEDVTALTLPQTFTGDNTCATNQCSDTLASDGETWHAFVVPSTMDIQLEYCGSGGGTPWLNGFTTLVQGCPCASFIYADAFDFTSCGDGNPTLWWNGVPAGTYYYPVMKDASNDAIGAYTITVTGNTLSQLTVTPTFIDFGVHAEGETGGVPVTLASSGGSSDINFTVSYLYSTKGGLPGGVAEMGTEELNVFRGDYTGPDYVNPGTKQGGDDIATAVVITPTMPFTVTGTTAGYNNDYDEVCTFTGSTAPDVVYSWTPSADIAVDIDLCNSAYDTKLYLYENTYTPGAPFACSDDACPGYMSELLGLDLVGGNTYYIVVDGYGTNEGVYQLDIDEEFIPEPFECPAGAGLESEACGEDLNGGCNATPVPAFEPINCGDTICGTSWADGGTRDTDWYLITLYSETELSVTGSANFPFIIGFVDTSDCATAAAVDPYATGLPSEVQTASRTAGPGTYWLFVSYNLTTYEGYPCGTFNDYWIVLDCPEGPVLWVSADPESGTIAPGGSFPMDINFNTTGMEEGVYNATVNIEHDGGKATSAIPVTIEVGTGTPAVLVATPTAINFGTVHEGDAGSDVLTISNGGSGTINFGAVLDYGAKDITGAEMTTSSTYQPGATQDLVVAMSNPSPDTEWLVGCDVTAPLGVTIVSATDFIEIADPGNYLNWQLEVGDGATTSWYFDETYGIYDGQVALATISCTYDGALTGDQSFGWSIEGDGWGGEPHATSGTFLVPLYVDPALNWCTLAPMGGSVPPDAPLTVSFDATDLPAGTYTVNIVLTDDTRAETIVPVTLSVFEWDGVALAPAPVLAIEQNATSTHYGYIYLGDDFAGSGYGGVDITGVVGLDANGTALTVTGSYPGTHPLVYGDAYVVEFVLNDFAAAYGWPTGLASETFDVTVSTAGGDIVVTDAFLYAGHISGDLTMDGEIDISDLIMMVSYMFQEGDAPQVMATMDINGDRQVADIADLIYLVNFMFQEGPAPLYAD